MRKSFFFASEQPSTSMAWCCLQVLHSNAVSGDTLLELSREVSALHRIRHGYIVQFYGLTILRQHYDGAIAIVTERFVDTYTHRERRTSTNSSHLRFDTVIGV